MEAFAQALAQQRNSSLFHITHADAQSIKQQLQLSEQEFVGRMLEMLLTQGSIAPISHFAAAAVARVAASQDYYSGVNIEVVGRVLSNSVHAEQCLVSNIAMHDAGMIDVIATAPAPCGHCRQFLRETFGAESIKAWIYAKHVQDGDVPTTTITTTTATTATTPVPKQTRVTVELRTQTTLLELLPCSFGPADLGCKRVLLQPEVPCDASAWQVVDDKATNSDSSWEHMTTLALANLDRSYAPHTNCPSCVVVRVASKQQQPEQQPEQQQQEHGSSQIGCEAYRYFVGVYLENAAYNPSLPPLQCALASMVTNGECDLHAIDRAVLLESSTDGAAILTSQLDNTTSALAALAPTAAFKYRVAAHTRQ
jgi:cytidine deaminase